MDGISIHQADVFSNVFQNLSLIIFLLRILSILNPRVMIWRLNNIRADSGALEMMPLSSEVQPTTLVDDKVHASVPGYLQRQF